MIKTPIVDRAKEGHFIFLREGKQGCFSDGQDISLLTKINSVAY